MKRSTFALAIIAVLFVSVLFLLYLNFYKTPNLISTLQIGIIPTEISTPTTDPTADWKIYKNDLYGFTFKYPNVLSITTSSSGIFSLGLGEKGRIYEYEGSAYGYPIEISFFENSENKNIEQWLEEYKTGLNGGTIQKTKLDGYEAGVKTNQLGIVTFAPKGNYLIEITASLFREKGFNLPLESIYNQILSTFKFTNTTADWKTYTNTSLKVQFSHPSSWTIRGFAGDTENFDKNETTYTRFVMANPDNSLSLTVANSVFEGSQDPCMVEQKPEVNQSAGGIVFIKSTFISQCQNTDIKFISFSSFDKKISLTFNYTNANQQESEKIIDQILSTFKFTNSTGMGTVTGNLCYPSEGIPSGTILAKNVSTNQIFTKEYKGSNVEKSTAFSFPLDPGTYHFKFDTSGTTGYYDKCAKTMESVDCQPDENHQHLNVTVASGKEISGISICDFYFTPAQETRLQSTF